MPSYLRRDSKKTKALRRSQRIRVLCERFGLSPDEAIKIALSIERKPKDATPTS